MTNVISKQGIIDQINALSLDGEINQQDLNYLINYLIANGNLIGTPRDMIQIRRGNKADLPVLAQGEMAFTLDTQELLVGGVNGNVDVLADIKAENETVLTYGARTTNNQAENKAAVQAAIAAIDSKGGGVLVIPHAINYGYNRNDVTTHPDLSATTNDIMIIDYSKGNTYTDGGRDGEQIRYFTKTEGDVEDGQHDGGTMWWRSGWAPAIMIMNDGVDTDNRRATIFFGNRGKANWGIGQGTKTISGGTDLELSDFAITAHDAFGGTGATNVFGIDKATGEFGIGMQPAPGVAFSFLSRFAGNMIMQYRTQGPNQTIDQQFLIDGVTKRRIQVDKDGNIFYINGAGSVTSTIEVDSTMYGNKNKIVAKTAAYTVTPADCKTTFTNDGAVAGFTITLPQAVAGLEYSFFCNNANNLAVKPQAGNSYRGLADAADKRSSTAGSHMTIKCVIAGTWDVIQQSGTWT